MSSTDNFKSLEKDFELNVYSTQLAKSPRKECEMSHQELQMLSYLIRTRKPQKMVEAGVAAGGTTAIILEDLPATSTLYSIDFSKEYYRDKEKVSGYIALEEYRDGVHPKWERYMGVDISQCIDKIGGEIDFFLLDTVHSLPGEFLSFLVALPFMKENSILVLHDICWGTINHMKKIPPSNIPICCNTLLYSAIYSPEKLLLPGRTSNIGAIFIYKEMVMKQIDMVMHMLFLDWLKFPPLIIIENTRIFIQKYYEKRTVELYDRAVEFHMKRLKISKSINDAFEQLHEQRQHHVTLEARQKQEIEQLQAQQKQEIQNIKNQRRQEVDQLRKQVEYEKMLRTKMKKSFSWRVTAPLRTIGHLVGGKKSDLGSVKK